MDLVDAYPLGMAAALWLLFLIGDAITLGAAGAFWFLFLIQVIYVCSVIRGYRRKIDEGYFFTEKLSFGPNGAYVSLTAIHPSNVDLSGEIPRIITRP